MGWVELNNRCDPYGLSWCSAIQILTRAIGEEGSRCYDVAENEGFVKGSSTMDEPIKSKLHV